MNRVRRNVLANYVGHGWSALANLLCAPVFLYLLGVEAYALIGLHVSVLAFFLVFDAGLSSVLNRELALGADCTPEATGARRRDMARTLELIHVPLSLVVVGTMWAASGPLASRWLDPAGLGAEDTASALALMGAAVAAQWPSLLYAGGLRGLERQVKLNALHLVFVTLRTAAAIPVLLIWPTLDAFFLWQVLVGLVQSVVYRQTFWSCLSGGESEPRARFRKHLLREVVTFGAGLAGVGLLSFLVAHADRIILSRLLPLEQFGYYVLAATAASAIAPITQPFFHAFFPRFSALVGVGAKATLETAYRESTQALSIPVFAVAAVLSVFSWEALYFWSWNTKLADNSATVLSVLVVAAALNGVTAIPYALQLAHGYTRIALVQNAMAVALLLPLTYILAQTYGAVGAAIGWLAYAIAAICIAVPLAHRLLLPGVSPRWFARDVGPPALAAFAVAASAKVAFPSDGELHGLVVMAGAACAALVATTASVPFGWKRLHQLRNWAAG